MKQMMDNTAFALAVRSGFAFVAMAISRMRETMIFSRAVSRSNNAFIAIFSLCAALERVSPRPNKVRLPSSSVMATNLPCSCARTATMGAAVTYNARLLRQNTRQKKKYKIIIMTESCVKSHLMQYKHV